MKKDIEQAIKYARQPGVVNGDVLRTLAAEVERLDIDLHMAKALLGHGVYTAGDKMLKDNKE